MDTYVLLIALCLIIVASYVFGVIGTRLRIPSVMLLIGTGIGLHQLAVAYDLPIGPLDLHVQMLGTVGLIMIVMEAALDLRIRRAEMPRIRQALGAAAVILVASSVSITALIAVWLEQPLLNSLIYAIPLSIVSSAVVIPSTVHLQPDKRSFIIYESSLSDILGILLFNFFALGNSESALSVASYVGNLAASVVISVAASVALVYLLIRQRGHARFYLLFSVLIALYAAGKLLHVPSLILIMFFGLLVANWEQMQRLARVAWLKVPENVLQSFRHELGSMTAETSFIVRTFFFVIFGFTIDLSSLMHMEVVVVGSAIVGVLTGIRYLYLRYVMGMSKTMPELLLMPRGLITILLFYSIPAEYHLSQFNEGVIFFVIVASALLMMVGLMVYKTEEEGVLIAGADTGPAAGADGSAAGNTATTETGQAEAPAEASAEA